MKLFDFNFKWFVFFMCSFPYYLCFAGLQVIFGS